jgi:hypothetical protein
LRRGRLGEAAAGLEVGGHVVEGLHELGHFAGSDEGDAALVFAGGDFAHGVGERLNGPGDLLRKKEREPDAGEEDDGGDEQQHEEEDGTNAVAGTEELPVGGGAVADACGGLAESLGHGECGDDRFARCGDRHAHGIFLSGDANDRLIVALRGGKQTGVERTVELDDGLGDAGVGFIGKPGNEAGRVRFRRSPKGSEHLAVFVVHESEAALQRDAVRIENSLECRQVAVGRSGISDGFSFSASVAGDVLREFEDDAGGVLVELGGVWREPAIDGAVHQLEAEEEHEGGWRQSDEDGAKHHAGAEARAEGTAGLAGVELEDVPEQQQKQDEEEEEDDDGEAGKGEGFASGFRIEEADVGGIEGIQSAEQGE